MSDHIPPSGQCQKGMPLAVRTLGERVRQDIEHGADTDRNKVDPETVLRLLNNGLAAEIACVQHCRRRHYAYMLMATTSQASSVAAECLEHGAEEQLHADRLADRIRGLGGEPDLDLGLLGQSYARCADSQDPVEMIREDLVAECNIIEGYREMIRYLGEEDPTTRCMLLDILADEERHAQALVDLLHDQGV